MYYGAVDGKLAGLIAIALGNDCDSIQLSADCQIISMRKVERRLGVCDAESEFVRRSNRFYPHEIRYLAAHRKDLVFRLQSQRTFEWRDFHESDRRARDNPMRAQVIE